MSLFSIFLFFFFNDTATTEIYTLSLHDALPIFRRWLQVCRRGRLGTDWRAKCRLGGAVAAHRSRDWHTRDRKSTRLNSSHLVISYAVFCLKKKKIDDCLTRQTTCDDVHLTCDAL